MFENCQGSRRSSFSSNSSPRPCKRRPVRVNAPQRPKIRRLNLKAAAEIHFLRLDDPGLGVFNGPDQARQNRRGHLHARGILVGGQLPRLFNGKLRAIPIGILLVAIEEHAEFIAAIDNLLFLQDMRSRLPLAARAKHFKHRQHRVIGRVIGIMAGGPVGDALSLPHREIIGNGNGLVMGDQQAEMRPRRGNPAPHPRIGPGPGEIDRSARALFVLLAVVRQLLLMGAPAQFGRLQALGNESVYRPGVDEHIERLRILGTLRIALGNVNALHAQAASSASPRPRAWSVP